MVMPIHKQVYMREMGCAEDDSLFCETPKKVNPDCEYIAMDIHHVNFKSGGGEDVLINLVALCRNCHDKAHGLRGGNKRMYFNIYKKYTKKRDELLRRVPL